MYLREIRRSTLLSCVAILCGMLLSGCTMTVGKVSSLDTLIDAEGVEVIDLYVPETRVDHSCGTQALVAAMLHHDPDGDVYDLLRFEPEDERGANVVELIREARKRGYEITLHQGDWDLLLAEMHAGNPPIVLFDVATDASELRESMESTGGLPIFRVRRSAGTPPRMHWGVVTVMADSANLIGMGLPDNKVLLIDKENFLERWETSAFCTLVVRGLAEPSPASE